MRGCRDRALAVASSSMMMLLSKAKSAS